MNFRKFIESIVHDRNIMIQAVEALAGRDVGVARVMGDYLQDAGDSLGEILSIIDKKPHKEAFWRAVHGLKDLKWNPFDRVWDGWSKEQKSSNASIRYSFHHERLEFGAWLRFDIVPDPIEVLYFLPRGNVINGSKTIVRKKELARQHPDIFGGATARQPVIAGTDKYLSVPAPTMEDLRHLLEGMIKHYVNITNPAIV